MKYKERNIWAKYVLISIKKSKDELVGIFVYTYFTSILIFLQPYDVPLYKDLFKSLLLAVSYVITYIIVFILLLSGIREKLNRTKHLTAIGLSIILCFQIRLILGALIIKILPENLVVTHPQFPLMRRIFRDFLRVMLVCLSINIPIYFSKFGLNFKSTQKRDTKKRELPARPPSEKRFIQFKGRNKGESLEIMSNEILFIQSSGHYVSIYYLLEDKVIRAMMRNSLIEIEKVTSGTFSIQRINKSILVNLSYAKLDIADSSNLILTWKKETFGFPISKKYLEPVHLKIAQFN